LGGGNDSDERGVLDELFDRNKRSAHAQQRDIA
jgi:hypothetical protein